jgi:putative ABC transport system ATP-binding protein
LATLEANELYRFFHAGDEEVKALRGVDLVLNAGEMVALVGPSGSGKSTLLMCLAGLDEPDGGSVVVCNETMTRRSEIEKTRLRSKYIGVMLQKENLFAHLTVLENVHAAQAVNGTIDQSHAESILERIGMKGRSASLPAQLSGGERARAGLAVALSRKPAVLLLDEPTGEVDAETENDILKILNGCRVGGTTIIIATHNAAVARSAGRILTMKNGRLANG